VVAVFTGLVAELGEVEAIERHDSGARIAVRAALASELFAGESIAVDGVCLTALEPADGRFTADLSEETLACSTLGAMRVGDRVNLEPAMGNGGGRELRFRVRAELLRYVAEKGSVAINGVSLTVAGLDESGFCVALIPETLRRTNLTGLSEGDRANLEVDLIAKYVEKLVRAYPDRS
jgi:riboflavin synthase